MLTPEEFHYAFTNTLTEAESQALYERYAIPGLVGRCFRSRWPTDPHAPSRVSFDNDRRAPLLLIAGGEDHTAPASVTRAELALQRKSQAVTAYKEFSKRPHLIIAGPGWEEVADYALAWARDPKPSDEA